MKHYPWLDGIRGLAALFVLLHHAAFEVKADELPPWVVASTAWLEHGHLAVAVFIVLSGFSLMLPVARDGEIRGGFRGYLARRARRILPPYYAALVFCLFLIAVVPVLQIPNGNRRWDFALPAFETGPIVAHLLMIHNFKSTWIFRIDPPTWSVAVEWQIYFLFPVLVVAWRKLGHVASLLLALVVPFAALPLLGGYLFWVSSPWYTVLFGFGMMAACSTTERPIAWFPRRSWIGWFIVAGLIVVLCLLNDRICREMVVGMITAIVIASLARPENEGRAERPRRIVRGVLGSRPAVALGAFSYSLYLIHFPLLSLASNLMLARGTAPTVRFSVLVFGTVPLIVAIAYLFHIVYERPFLVKTTRSSGKARSPFVAIPG